MNISAEKPDYFTAEIMFDKGKNCKVFSLSTPQKTSGDILHSHDYMQIWYITKGNCTHWIEGKKHDMLQGEAFILPPNMLHKTIMGQESEIMCCEFSLDNFLMTKEGSNFSVLKETIMDLSFMTYFVSEQQNIKPKFSLSFKNQHVVESLMKNMLAEYSNDSIYSEQFLRVYILQLLLIFAREYYTIPTQKESSAIFHEYKNAVEKAIFYINKHYAEPLTLEDVCKFSHLSKTYFCYLFKLLTQQTFVEYLRNYRIKQAIKLLETTDLPITTICFDVGFNNVSHFSRTFKQVVGHSPRTHRTLHYNTENK